MAADKRKKFRKIGGAGDIRYVMCERGILSAEDILPGWGLLWVCGKIVRMVKNPRCVDACAIGLRRERYLLTAHIERIQPPLFAGTNKEQ